VLARRGVKVRTGTPVKRIEPDSVELPDGSRIEARTIVLAAGVAVNPLLASFPVEKDQRGRILTDATMRSTSHPNVWAIGDCATIPDPEGKPYPPLAQHALREARVLARNLVATLRGGPAEPFVYKTMGVLASLGHYSGVGRVTKFKIRGFLAWWAWRSYYLMQMPRFERKLRIVLDWTVALFFPNDIVKLDLFAEGRATPRDRDAGRAAGAMPPAAAPAPARDKVMAAAAGESQ
jgi:NADH dehydrogenase